MKTKIYLAACGVGIVLSVIVYVVLQRPQFEIARRKAVIERMTEQRDSFRSNPAHSNALQSLVLSLRSDDPFEQTRAAVFLGQVGPAGEAAVEPLVEVLQGSNLYAAREAAASLGELGVCAKDALPEMASAVERYPRADVGSFAVRSLGQIADPTNSQVRAILERASESTYESMRLNAQIGLRIFDSK